MIKALDKAKRGVIFANFDVVKAPVEMHGAGYQVSAHVCGTFDGRTMKLRGVLLSEVVLQTVDDEIVFDSSDGNPELENTISGFVIDWAADFVMRKYRKDMEASVAANLKHEEKTQ